MAGAANEGGLIPEQVWDDQPPSGTPGFPKGEGTLSATPLAWSHAQFVRLAWSIEAGAPGRAAEHRGLPLRTRLLGRAFTIATGI